MEINEYLDCRQDLLAESKDENGFVCQQLVLSQILPFMLDAKLVDSEDYNECYFKNESDNLKLNGYAVNESGERLQLFLVDEGSIQEDVSDDLLFISNRSDYDSQFKRTARLISSAIRGKLDDQLQNSDPVAALVAQISSTEGIEQFDVIEIFLISLTATVSKKSDSFQPRQMHFSNDALDVSYHSGQDKKSKSFLLIRSLIDLNFLFNVIVSRGSRQPLLVNFKKTFGYDIHVIEAAKEKKFESYLCVLTADVLADLYRQYSSRLLEKNVRSFLQFKGVNKGLKETIRNEPDRFIAYNNGLTLTATNAKVNLKRGVAFIEALEDLQIVNGGQTTASIYFSKKEGLDISNVKVMAKINVVKELGSNGVDDLISKISKYSNTQSKVSNVDLRSRNPQLVKLKKLSESVITPSGTKWFFERSKGEFNTKVRIAGSNGNRIKRDFPINKRFSKEQLAKYYSAWGDEPYLVKRGGEKVFRHFIEKISPSEDDTSSEVVIDRDFFEELIAKIILFRRFEKIYGQGKNSMGQLRSAAIPYAMSIIHCATDGKKNAKKLDFLRIWREEGLGDDFDVFSTDLLLLTNELIKKYSLSEDYGEYSKKPELWGSIKTSKEIKKFLNKESTEKILDKYTK